jgi:NAD+ kinase
MMVQAVVVFSNTEKPEARREELRLKAWCRERGVRVIPVDRAADAQLAVVLGGDGTILRAGRHLATLGIPVLGVNFGHLGFLAGTEPRRMYRALTAALKGKLRSSTRMMLQVEAPRAERQAALNDCVIRVIRSVRLLQFSVWVDDTYLATYHGDGLIVSTPTGSTAYSMAAAGPVVQPEMDLILLTPISPHSLTQRPLALSADGVLRVKVESPKDGALLSVDGQLNHAMYAGEEVVIRRARERCRILYENDRTFFSLLRGKLKWGER